LAQAEQVPGDRLEQGQMVISAVRAEAQLLKLSSLSAAAPEAAEQQQQGMLEMAQCKPITGEPLEPMELLVFLEIR
jgi:hypothetical protein